jgi:hypothetical protein
LKLNPLTLPHHAAVLLGGWFRWRAPAKQGDGDRQQHLQDQMPARTSSDYSPE